VPLQEPAQRNAGWKPFALATLSVWTAGFLAQAYSRFDGAPAQVSAWCRAFGVDPFRTFGRFELLAPLTYACLHENLVHLLLNVICLVGLGAALTRRLGAPRAISYALAGCVVGGIASGAVAFLSPGLPVIGGTGLVSGLAAVYLAVCGSDVLLYVGARPVPAGALVHVLLLGSLVASVAGGQMANLAQAFGAFGGWLCFRLEPGLARWLLRRRLLYYERELERERDLVENVDQILAKVHQAGLDRLTRRERSLLKQASRIYRQKSGPKRAAAPSKPEDKTE